MENLHLLTSLHGKSIGEPPQFVWPYLLDEMPRPDAEQSPPQMPCVHWHIQRLHLMLLVPYPQTALQYQFDLTLSSIRQFYSLHPLGLKDYRQEYDSHLKQ